MYCVRFRIDPLQRRAVEAGIPAFEKDAKARYRGSDEVVVHLHLAIDLGVDTREGDVLVVDGRHSCQTEGRKDDYGESQRKPEEDREPGAPSDVQITNQRG